MKLTEEAVELLKTIKTFKVSEKLLQPRYRDNRGSSKHIQLEDIFNGREKNIQVLIKMGLLKINGRILITEKGEEVLELIS